jgi:multidrug resistance efflux pump
MMYRSILIALLLTAPLALAQTTSTKNSPQPLTKSKSAGTSELTPSKTTPGRLKINLSIANPQDLKVREGDRVTKGQVLADRDGDRSRLNRERRETLLTIAKIEQTPPPRLKIAPPIQDLPAAGFAIEETAIEQAELKFSQAQRNYNSTLANDPFITARANVDFARAAVEQAYREVELQGKKLEAIAQIKGIPPEMLEHETEKLKAVRSEWEKKQAEYEFRAAEYKQVEQGRREAIESLKEAIDSARSELEIAQARLRAAKEARNKAEYDHQIAVAKQDEEKNQVAIAVSQQGLEREFKLSQLKERISAIDEKLSSIAVVRSPFAGLIKRVKIENQSDNTLKVTLSLIPE